MNSKPHNPFNLTPEKIGVNEGWRLLDEDELLDDVRYIGAPNLFQIQILGSDNNWIVGKAFKGISHDCMFRTKLTREDLRIARFGGEPTRISISADLGASMLRELTDANYLLNEILDYTPWHARSGPLYEKIKQFLNTH